LFARFRALAISVDPHSLERASDLRVRVERKLLTHEPGVNLGDPDRLFPGALRTERPDQSSRVFTSQGVVLDEPPPPVGRCHWICLGLGAFGEAAKGPSVPGCEPVAFNIGPALEVWCLRNMKAGEEGTGVELECPSQVPAVQQALEPKHITV
jgi:hypothetical protein